MNMFSKRLLGAVIFLVILFASVSVADVKELSADEITQILEEIAGTYELTQDIDEYIETYEAIISFDLEKVRESHQGVDIDFGVVHNWGEHPYISINGVNYYFATSSDCAVHFLDDNKIYIERDNERIPVNNISIGFTRKWESSTSNEEDKENIIATHFLNADGKNEGLADTDYVTGVDGEHLVSIGNVGGSLTIEFESEEVNIDGTIIRKNPNDFEFSVDKSGIYQINAINVSTPQKVDSLKICDEYGNVIEKFEYMSPTGMGNVNLTAYLEANKRYILKSDSAQMSSVEITYMSEQEDFDDYVEKYEVESLYDLETKTIFQNIEELFSGLVIGIAKTLNYLISNALGQTITIDDIVFNSYSEIRLDFFKYDLNGQAVVVDSSETSTINLLRDAITTWYKNFRMIALAGYMVILVYIGVKILMNSTTPNAKAKAKEMFTTWIMGLALLTFLPYMMKFIIVLNDSVVKYIDGGRSYKDRTTSSIDPSVSQGLIYTDYDNVILFDGNDYMSAVGKLASQKLKLGFALTYLILTWQLVMLIIYYYKRLFITAFLIIIFPLIALMYAWDKLNDGKSQSLSMWLREFAMSVFVQTFHAIVYVFIVDVIYSTIDASSYDFILLMIASSFLFAGENILKSIFGGGGEALGSVAQTAGKVSAITTTITQVGTRVVSNVVSKNGFVRKGMASFGEARKWHLLNKRGPDGMRNIDLLATNEATELRLNRLLPSEGEVTPTIRKAAEVVDTFNNLDKKKPEEIAKAREEFDRLMQKRKDGSMTQEERRQFDAIMQHSNININQLEKVDNAMANAAIAYSAAGNSKEAKKTIRQNLQLEIEVIINSADPKKVSKNKISKNTNNIIQASLINMRKNGISGLRRDDVSNVAREKVQNSNRVYNKINFLSKGGAGGTKNGTTKNPTAKNVRAKAIADRYKSSLDAKGQKIDEHTKQMIDNFAHKLADFEDVGVRDVDINTAYDMITDLPTNADGKEMLNQMAKLANLQAEIEDLKYLISKKAVSDTSVTPDIQQKFSAIVDSMESKAVSPSASVDVPAYTVSVNIANDRNDVSVDPYISIMDIINASNDNGGNVNDFNNMINAAANSTAIDQIVDSKMKDIRTGNQERWSESKDFAEENLKYFEEITKSYEYEEKTYMGYTPSEAKEMERAAYGDFVTNAASALSDVVTLPAGAVFGAAVGAAYTTDGMPLGEIAGGVTAGTKMASAFSDNSLPGFANAQERGKTINKINEKVKNRLENNEKASLKARNLFENAQYANRGNADTYLTLDGFTANLIVDANDDLTAILHIMAKNAEYVSVNEQPGAGNWQSFQENISYTFRDGDYKKSHSLYVYVKDASGNIKNSVQYNLKP